MFSKLVVVHLKKENEIPEYTYIIICNNTIAVHEIEQNNLSISVTFEYMLP